MVVKDGKRQKVHNLVAEAFLGPRPSSTHTVDHIDRDVANNRVENLRWASKTEQVANRALPKNKAGSRPIEVNFGAGWIQYPSVNEAARVHGFNLGSISQLLHGKGRVKSVNGAVARFVSADDADQEGEEWREVANCMVSNRGRVIGNQYAHKYTPVPQKETGYCKAYGHYVHRLVMEAFGPPRPGPDFTVDHVNRVRHDNQIANLRWASKQQQNDNHSKKRKCEDHHMKRPVAAIFPNGKKVRFESAAAAQKETGVDYRRISEACNGKSWNKKNPRVHRGSGIRFDWV